MVKAKRKKLTGYNDPAFTVGVFQTINKEWDGRDIVQLFCSMYGADYNEVFNLPDEQGVGLYKYVEFMYADPIDWSKIPAPETLKAGGKELLVPKHIGKLSFGQVTRLRQKIDAAKSTTIDSELISYAAALYFYKQYYAGAKLEDEKLNALEALILTLPIIKVYPISFFLLTPRLSLGKILIHRSQSIWGVVKRKMQTSLLSLTRLRISGFWRYGVEPLGSTRTRSEKILHSIP